MQPLPATRKTFKSLRLMAATILFFSLSISGTRVTNAADEQSPPAGAATPATTPEIVTKDAWNAGYPNDKQERNRAGLEDILVPLD